MLKAVLGALSVVAALAPSRQVDALKSASYGTKGVSLVVPSLLYTKAGMASVIQATEEATAAGPGNVDGYADPLLEATRFRFTVPE
jgi:hypothetical protein